MCDSAYLNEWLEQPPAGDPGGDPPLPFPSEAAAEVLRIPMEGILSQRLGFPVQMSPDTQNALTSVINCTMDKRGAAIMAWLAQYPEIGYMMIFGFSLFGDLVRCGKSAKLAEQRKNAG